MTDSVDSAHTVQSADAAVTAWEDPPRVDRRDAAPVLTVDGFEGPLDWWLEMARAQKIDLAKLSIATLIESFATAMDAALARRAGDLLPRWAVWTVMAATLTELWSRLLLPSDAPAARAAFEEAEALRRQLLDRARTRAAADFLERRVQLGRDAFRRGCPEVSATGRGGDLTELLRACLPALQVPEDQVVALRPRPPPLWTVSDALTRVARLLSELPDGSPLAAYLPPIPENVPARALRCRAAMASTLIAGLIRTRARWRPAAGSGGRVDAHPCHAPRNGRSCRGRFCATRLTDDATMIGPAVGRRNCSQSATLLLSEPLDEYVGPETLSALSRPLLKCWTSRAPVSPG
jgi:segregation and condensation protein A